MLDFAYVTAHAESPTVGRSIDLRCSCGALKSNQIQRTIHA